jgi:hypothetical protein
LQTTLQGTPITTFDTGDDSIGVVSMTVRQPPGDYVLAILPTSGGSGSSAVVTVLECPIGDVAASTGDACITCVSGSYSFNSKNITCDDACPANAGMHLLFYFFIVVFGFGFFTKESKKYVLKKKVCIKSFGTKFFFLFLLTFCYKKSDMLPVQPMQVRMSFASLGMLSWLSSCSCSEQSLCGACLAFWALGPRFLTGL